VTDTPQLQVNADNPKVSLAEMDEEYSRGMPIGPVDGRVVPRFAGLTTFARLPRIEDVEGCDVAVVGIPFDTGVSYRPGARFGPSHIRQCSRVLRPYNPELEVSPFDSQQVVDAGDIICTPYDIAAAVRQIEQQASALIESGAKLVSLAATTPSPTPCCARITAATDRWRWCTSTLTSTRGTRTSTHR